LLDHLLGPGAAPTDPGRLDARLTELRAKAYAPIAAVSPVASLQPRKATTTAAPIRYCSKCGAEVKATARFCGGCGAKL